MPGRRRKPTAMKVIEGTWRADRARPNEPAPRRARPRPPGRLSPLAREAWTQIVGIADALGVLAGADALAVESFAEAVADLRAARESLSLPLIVNGVTLCAGGVRYYTSGRPEAPFFRARPELRQIEAADKRVAGWIARFGFSPADRGKVSALPSPEPNAFSMF